VFHGPGLAALDAKYGGSIIDAQVERALADAPWPAGLLADVASVTIDDFDLIEAGGRNSPDINSPDTSSPDIPDINDSLDLVAIAERP
jgi:hypothetical protein